MADKRESIDYKTKVGYGLINSDTKPDYSVKGGHDSGVVVDLDSKTGNISAVGDINVKVNVEVSEAITGLKALQREAKAATKALAELRDYMEETGEVTLKNGAEVAQSLRALFDKLDEEQTVYLDGKEIGKASRKGTR